MKRSWGEYFATVIFAILLAVVVRFFILTAYKVPTGSMQPALKPGDFIFSWRLAYKDLGASFFSDQDVAIPARGDLVVFTYPSVPAVSYVKRVMGLPGDKVEIREGRLWLNDEPLKYEKKESAVENPNPEMFEVWSELDPSGQRSVILEIGGRSRNFGPLVVPPGEVFVLGDNRDASDDSRYWGTVPASLIQGKVILIWLSVDPNKSRGMGVIPQIRWDRVFTLAK